MAKPLEITITIEPAAVDHSYPMSFSLEYKNSGPGIGGCQLETIIGILREDLYEMKFAHLQSLCRCCGKPHEP